MPEPSQNDDTGTLNTHDLGGCRILLVEDNKMNQMVIKLAVKK